MAHARKRPERTGGQSKLKRADGVHRWCRVCDGDEFCRQRNLLARGGCPVADDVADEARRELVIRMSLFAGWGFANIVAGAWKAYGRVCEPDAT